MFLKYRYREELFGIRNTQIKRRYKKGNAYVPTTIYSVVSDEKDRECTAILKDKNSNIEIVGVKTDSAADRKFEQKGKMAEW